LAAVFLSNLIHRFIPQISVPVLQIILGVCISFLPLGLDTELNPDLFFVLFIAPLVFNTSMLLDKKTFWSLKGPILNTACLLVVASIIGIGYFVHLLIPVIPLAAACMLIASLGPTDDVAVLSVSKRIAVPPRLMNILFGESIINDATSIVSFQLAMAIIVSGIFSPVHVTGQFIVIGLGGLLSGTVFTGCKYIFVQWRRRLGMENVTLHILLEILTPFCVYLLAEAIGVSGIRAVFAAGVAHSVKRDKFNPDRANLNIASKSIWDVLSFTLEAVVYLILGTQLPRILQTVQSSILLVSIWELILYVTLITLAFITSRFVWFYLTVRKNCIPIQPLW
jgi:CPA1 family monovalent cation:H+ antiporter